MVTVRLHVASARPVLLPQRLDSLSPRIPSTAATTSHSSFDMSERQPAAPIAAQITLLCPAIANRALSLPPRTHRRFLAVVESWIHLQWRIRTWVRRP